VGTIVGQSIAAVVLSDCGAKACVAKKQVSVDLIIHLLFVFNGVHEIATLYFLVTLYQDKVATRGN